MKTYSLEKWTLCNTSCRSQSIQNNSPMNECHLVLVNDLMSHRGKMSRKTLYNKSKDDVYECNKLELASIVRILDIWDKS